MRSLKGAVPVGDWEGVPKDHALRALKAHGVDVFLSPEDPEITILVRGDLQEAFKFPILLRRRMLRSLARKFEVPYQNLIYASGPPQDLN